MVEPKEALLRNVITHATGGNCTGEGMGLNDICVSISAHRNEVYARGVERGKATLAAENAALREKLADLRNVLGEICKVSNPDWSEKRAYPDDVLDDIHQLAANAYYGKSA